jgi:hypothetical protein
MGKRRKLRGKRLLIVSGALAGASLFGCGDDGGGGMDAIVANLIPPEDTSIPDTSGGDSAMDSSAVDATSDGSADASGDGAAGDGSAGDGSAGDGG